MANYTPKFNLKKPIATENYNIADDDGNMDIIDTALYNATPLTGAIAPTTSTVGVVGQFYLETTTPQLYQCTAASGTYTWKVVSNTFQILSTTTVSAVNRIDLTLPSLTGLKKLILLARNIVQSTSDTLYARLNGDATAGHYVTATFGGGMNPQTYLTSLSQSVPGEQIFELNILLGSSAIAGYSFGFCPVGGTYESSGRFVANPSYINHANLTTINILAGTAGTTTIAAGAIFELYGVK